MTRMRLQERGRFAMPLSQYWTSSSAAGEWFCLSVLGLHLIYCAVNMSLASWTAFIRKHVPLACCRRKRFLLFLGPFGGVEAKELGTRIIPAQP